MMSIFNKTFSHFFFGFVAIVAASLLVVFSVGVYSTDIAVEKATASSGAPQIDRSVTSE